MSKGHWFVDASFIDVSTFDFEKYIAKTTKVNEFLDSSKFIISAPKGYGKTLLLKYVYHNLKEKYSGQKVVSIPSNTCIDSFDYKIPYEGKQVGLLSDLDIWQNIWQLAIGISIIINYSIITQDYEYLSEYRNSLLENNVKLTGIINLIEKIENLLEENKTVRGFIKIQANPSSILGNILSLPVSNIQSSVSAAVDKTYQWCLSLDRPVHVFLDQIDQGISEYPIDVWRNAQNGLVCAIFKLLSSRQIKIYASVRKEAWDLCQNELHGQFHDIISELTYTEKDLKEILKHAVMTYESATSVKKPEKYEVSPIEAFTGMQTVKNIWSDTEEDPFTYMLRHTLRRPRDLIMFGKEIHRLAKDNDLNEDNFRNSVNRIPGEEINKQYFKEISRFTNYLQYSNVEKFFQNINSNILTHHDLVDICGKFNHSIGICIAKKGGDCRDCAKSSHVFCDLYKTGLLGIVTMKEAMDKNTCLQHFETTGRVNSTFIPNSKYYLLHPALDYYIKEILEHFSYSPVKGAIIGHNEKWTNKHKALVCMSEIDKFLSANEDITGIETIKKLYNELNKTIASNNEKNTILSSFTNFSKSVTSDGFLAASSFSVNIINSVDKLSRIIQNF